MALSPIPTPQSSNPEVSEKFRDALVDAFERGLTPNEIAKKAYPTDKVNRKKLRRRIMYVVGRDEILARKVVERSRANMLIALPTAAQALGKRSKNGNVPAIKLLYEASGLHNPRIKHEHSGEVKITLDMPRPSFGSEGEVTDATVVDEPAQSEAD